MGDQKEKKLGAFVCGMRKLVVGARREEKVRVLFLDSGTERRGEAKSVSSRGEKVSCARKFCARGAARLIVSYRNAF